VVCLKVIEHTVLHNNPVYSQAVYTQYALPIRKETQVWQPIPMKVGEIAYQICLYVIRKPNLRPGIRDVPQGNGDTSLVLFGKKKHNAKPA
jgi:hypothetical protein